MALLKLVKMRMKLSNLLDLAYSGHVIIKIGKKRSLSVKKEQIKAQGNG